MRPASFHNPVALDFRHTNTRFPINDQWAYVAPIPESVTPFGGFYEPLAAQQLPPHCEDSVEDTAKCFCLKDGTCRPCQQAIDRRRSHAVAAARYDDGPLAPTAAWFADGFALRSRRAPGTLRHHHFVPPVGSRVSWERGHSEILPGAEIQTWQWLGRQVRAIHETRPGAEAMPPEPRPTEAETIPEVVEDFVRDVDRGTTAANENAKLPRHPSNDGVPQERMMLALESLIRAVEKNEATVAAAARAAVEARCASSQQAASIEKLVSTVERRMDRDDHWTSESLTRCLEAPAPARGPGST